MWLCPHETISKTIVASTNVDTANCLRRRGTRRTAQRNNPRATVGQSQNIVDVSGAVVVTVNVVPLIAQLPLLTEHAETLKFGAAEKFVAVIEYEND